MDSATNVTRLWLFIGVGLVHLALILFLAIRVNVPPQAPDQGAQVMKLTDLLEEEPPPPPPPPQAPPVENAAEAIAEKMIETDTAPDQVTASPLAFTPPSVQYAPPGEENYLPMHKVSAPPVFSEREIMAAVVYPPIALRSGIEGIVHLELFVDRQGAVQRIVILREEPPGRGFGEAAVKAFTGRQGKPAEANGEAVAVRYRYPVRFRIN
ncbi:MAG: energy transducer TonB [Treponema sp.]|jgi:protein TonB|nr:energy transducer TonB [Treponema sp.]